MGSEEGAGSESSQPTKKQRQSRPKVKTGCFTCKIRKVKCDETRPKCLRCQKTGRECDGYPIGVKGPPRAIAPRRQPLAIRAHPELPRGIKSFYTAHLYADRHPDRPLCILRNPTVPPSRDVTESYYFRVYCERTATKINGYGENCIWSSLIIQACQQEPFARHAVASLGALDLAMEYQALQSKALDKGNVKYLTNPHHQFALQQYGKALKLMRSSPSGDEEQHVRKALISCILITGFETYRGDSDLAVSQAGSAIKVLTSWLRKRNHIKEQGLTTEAPSRKSQVLEDDLINAFARLYKAVMVFRAPRPIELSKLLMPEAVEKMHNMPSVFSSLEEAQTYWEYHLRLALPWNYHKGFEALQASGFCKIDPDRISGHDPDYCPPAEGSVSRARLDAERRGLLKDLARWRAAMQPVWACCKTPAGAADFNNAAIMLLQSLCGIISFNAAVVSHECIYDAYLPEFKEMLWLIRTILNGAKPVQPGGGGDEAAKVFSFSVGVITSMYFVMNKCRDRAVRRELIELCAKYPRRDGAWDSEMVAAVGKWHVGKEEEQQVGLSADEPIPESARVRLMEVKIPPGKREVIIRYTLMRDADPRERIMPPPELIFW